jgi:hypothetical protein
MRTEESQENIVRLSDIRRGRERALTPFGPLNPASTTLLAQEIFRANQEARLMELLNSLESVVESLQYKSFTVYDTFNTAIEGVRVALSASTEDIISTEENVLQ